MIEMTEQFPIPIASVKIPGKRAAALGGPLAAIMKAAIEMLETMEQFLIPNSSFLINNSICSFPGFPDVGTVSHGGVFPVADNGGLEELRMLQQFFLPGLRGDIGHEQRFIGPAFCVHQGLEANFLLDGLVLSGG